MGNHDLLSDDDFFEKSKPGKKDPKDKKEEVYSEEEDFLKSKPLDQDALDLEDIESSLQERPETPSDKSYNLFEEDAEEREISQPEIRETEVPPPVPPPKSKEDLQYQKVYFDSDNKQQAINYKPFIIGIAIVIVLAVAGYFIYSWYVNSRSAIEQTETSQMPETSAPTDQLDQAESQLDQKKATFLSNIAGRTNEELGSVAGIIKASSGTTKLSSLLFYDSDLMFEVFGNNREELARLNIKLKNTFKSQDFKIISSSQRPGDNGGILGVYSARLGSAGASKKEVAVKFANGREADQWIQGIYSENKLKFGGVKSRSSKSEDMFTVYEIEMTANGSIENCMNAVNKIASAGSNVRIHKLICTALDQKDFSTGKYQLKLVLKIYA